MSEQTRIAELDKLFEQVGTYRKSSEFKELLVFIKKFRKFAPYNAMLLNIQKPGSRYVASASEWYWKYERKIKPGARPLVILQPFGPVAFVYELNDTEGKPFPENVENPFRSYGKVSDKELEKFYESLRYEGISVAAVDYGTEHAGRVQVIHDTDSIISKGEEIFFRKSFGITVSSNLDNPSRLATIYHELGHIFCGHLYVPEVKYLPRRYYLSYESEEFEAESVCWLLCERAGIKNVSAEYLSWYLDSNETIPDISLDTILKAVNSIEKIKAGVYAPRKELITGRKPYIEQMTLFDN